MLKKSEAGQLFSMKDFYQRDKSQRVTRTAREVSGAAKTSQEGRVRARGMEKAYLAGWLPATRQKISYILAR